jgi:hypothetical protein
MDDVRLAAPDDLGTDLRVRVSTVQRVKAEMPAVAVGVTATGLSPVVVQCKPSKLCRPPSINNVSRERMDQIG